MAPPGRPDHDGLYHRLFSDPAVTAQLLTTFVRGAWLDDLDLDGMERLNAKFHADTGERREGDMVWRIPRRDGEDTYLLLLLEFQSSTDQYMALRVLTYASLLWQQLAAEQRLMPGGKLPPILPVVLHSGDTQWRAPVALRDLIGLPEGSSLWPWQPALRYHLIDAAAFTVAELAARDGLPALWFRLEDASDPAELAAVAEAVISWLAAHPGFAAARAVFAELLGVKLAPLRPDVRVPEDLLGGRDMRTNRIEQSVEARERECRQAGEAAMLLRLLARRFGALPEGCTSRVPAADVAELEEWGLQLLDAPTIEDVFVSRHRRDPA
jgi:hypothetical protein